MKVNIGGPGVPPEVVMIHDDSISYVLDGDNFKLPGPKNFNLTASMGTLDIVRGQTHRVPGGIALAEKVKSLGADIDVLSIADMKDNAKDGRFTINSAFGLPAEYYDPTTSAPSDISLLFYIAHESIKEQQGRRLGKLGSLIVGETIISLIEKTIPEDGWKSSITDTDEVSFLDM